MRNSTLLLGFPFLAAIIFLGSCSHSPEYMTQPVPPGIEPPFDTIACDSNHVTYQGTVFPLLQTYCLSCHSGSTPAGALNFQNYEDVAWVAQSGQLTGSLNHLAGFSPMPRDASKLSACEIALMEKWVNDTTFSPSGTGSNCDPDTVYFENDVLPLLLSSCGISGCHDEQTAQEDIILTSYFHVMQSDVVKAFDPENSEMYENITEDDPDKRMPPPPSLSLNSEQISTIYTWIAQGALNNSCDGGDCDTLNVTFSGTVWPLIQNRCYGCHSGPSPQSGLSLENYSDISSAGAIPPGTYGSLLGAVSWDQGNSNMPKNGPQIPACNITQIRKWIDAGMPDN